MTTNANAARFWRASACSLLIVTSTLFASCSLNRQLPETADEEAMMVELRAAIAAAVPSDTFDVDINVDEGGVVTLSGVPASRVREIQIAAASVEGVRLVRFTSVVPDVTPAFPRFPWPPPDASAVYEIPLTLLSGGTTKPQLGSVADRIRRALATAGYPSAKFFAVPQGFAVLTRIEQTNASGKPKRGAARFALDIAPDDEFSLSSYINALIHGRKGFYRVIAIVVTPSSLPTSTKEPNIGELKTLTKSGTLLLPEEISRTQLGPAYHAWAFIYEFAKADHQTTATFVAPSRVAPEEHMRQSRILPALERQHAAR